jgi:hypothetical protein
VMAVDDEEDRVRGRLKYDSMRWDEDEDVEGSLEDERRFMAKVM